MSENAQDFKLLAIRPLKGCDPKYCNNLITGTLFQFYSYYKFTYDSEGINLRSIEQTGSDLGIYNEFVKRDDLKINISAIVGKNGSGKSTLAELFYLCCYLVAQSNDLIHMDDLNPQGIQELAELKEIKAGLKLEIFYQADSSFYCIVFDPAFKSRSQEPGNINYFDFLNEKCIPLKKFFYSIAVNYSIYGLNERTIGQWIGRLFHKNDGYQTPLVINPFRDEGTVNVNNEILFAQTRLLSNLRSISSTNGEVIPGKKITAIVFEIDRNRINRATGFPVETIEDEINKATGLSKLQIFNLVHKKMLGVEADHSSMSNPDWAELTINYVFFKLVAIARKYPDYKGFFRMYEDDTVPGLTDVPGYLDELEDDFTHVTLKLRQALNFFRNDPLRADHQDVSFESGKIRISAELFAERFSNFIDLHQDRDPMEFVPIAPFSPRIILEDGISFDQLSSGEQQYIHSIQGVLYHILNVNTVFAHKKLGKRVTYKYINIFFDEIELYFHPEFQRNFLKDFTETISQLNIPEIKGINVLFLTHSPFILSDILSTNVLQLSKGDIADRMKRTFAANIHSLLADSFFMDSTTGAFAKYQYDKIIAFYHQVRLAGKDVPEKLKQEYFISREKFLFIIGLIGEEVIRGVLNNHIKYLDGALFYPLEDRKQLKAQLENEIEEMKRRLEAWDDQD